MATPALLALEDGSLFRGIALGATGESRGPAASAVGEVVFNTAMTGYQEILTDPSYARQIVTLTYPHIGNTGINDEDNEASRTWCAGLVIRDATQVVSSFRAKQDLSGWMRERHIVGIADIDTRRLTRLLREKGSLNGCIVAGEQIDEQAAVEGARKFPGLKGMDLAKEVTCAKPYAWKEGTWKLGAGHRPAPEKLPHKVVAYDFGVKTNILRMLVDRGCELTVVPAKTSAADVLAMKPDGVFLSNGPGDPAPCDYAIAAIREFLKIDLPVFGICLGHQLLALASGAQTLKMPHGHHGANHPVQDIDSGRVMITSQNHGFAVDEKTLPVNLRVTHRSLFDGSNQGIHRTDRPAFSFQGHPEASPGPHEADVLFDHFIELMQARKI